MTFRQALTYIPVLLLILLISCTGNEIQQLVFDEDFQDYEAGERPFFHSGPQEICFEPERNQLGRWKVAVSSPQEGFDQAWSIDQEAGRTFLKQEFSNLDKEYFPLSLTNHPMILSGDTAWRDITFKASFSPGSRMDKCGVVFGYHNQHDHYYFGLEGNTLVLKRIGKSETPKRPNEQNLRSRPYMRDPGELLNITVTIRRNRITTSLNDSIHLFAEVSDYSGGRIGFLSDMPASFYSASVKMLNVEQRQISRKQRMQQRQDELHRRDFPEKVLWKTFDIMGYGASPNLRLGDLTGDGNKEMIFVSPGKNAGQVAAISCFTLDGEVLWSTGKPSSGNEDCTGEELPVQVHDLDGDGNRELIYVSGTWLYVLDGKSGKRIRRSRVVGGLKIKSLLFADLKESGRDNCIILSDRRERLLALDERGRFLWMQKCASGSEPLIYDLDGDGKDEILMGYAIYAPDGELLQNHADFFLDECKGLTLTGLRQGERTIPAILYVAGDDGLVYFDLQGNFLKQVVMGHVSYASICNLDLEEPGYEVFTSNGRESEGMVYILDASANTKHVFLAEGGTNRCVPVNWKGDGEEFLMTSPAQHTGGLYDFNGLLSVSFPADDHPQTYYRAVDMIGDARDEILVWDSESLWIYTQEDNPRMRNTYDPVRKATWNFSMHGMSYSVEKGKPF